jgi:hypothetical protein
LGDHPEGFAKPQIEAFARLRVTARAAHFHVSGIPETWKCGLIGSETATLFRFRAPDQVHHRPANPNEQSACSAPAPKGYPSVSVQENDWNYWNGWNHWNRVLLDVFPSAGGSQSGVNGNFFPTNPDESTGFKASKFPQKDFIVFERNRSTRAPRRQSPRSRLGWRSKENRVILSQWRNTNLRSILRRKSCEKSLSKERMVHSGFARTAEKRTAGRKPVSVLGKNRGA